MSYTQSPSCQIPGLHQLYDYYFGNIEGYFVDLGAYNGVEWSNTYGLAQSGWSGLLIEPNPKEYQSCQWLYSNNPKVQVCNCAIGNYTGKGYLYLGGASSTIRQETIEEYSQVDWLKIVGLTPDKCIECDVFTLDELLKRYDCPYRFEVLSIDIEGSERDVLQVFSINKWQPRMVIIETHEKSKDKILSSKSVWINHYFDNHGYVKIYSDHINSIYYLK